jgi:triacylglycerol lipase
MLMSVVQIHLSPPYANPCWRCQQGFFLVFCLSFFATICRYHQHVSDGFCSIFKQFTDMTNAWVQRIILVATCLGGWLLAGALWENHPVWAVLCLLMPVVITPLILGIQCIWSARANRSDPSPRAKMGQWLRAWWAEWGIAMRVFCWWQPFRHRAVTDHLQPTAGKRGMVLVHGFFCNRALWTHWMQRLHAQGRVFVAVDLEPAYGSIDEYAQILEQAIAQVEKATGLPPVLVGHSMGGLAIRAWVARFVGKTGQLSRVSRIITQGTPHQGTLIANLSHTFNGSQMRVASAWLSNNALQLPDDFAKKITCFYSNCDNIVFPASTATWPGADNQLIEGRAHVELAFVKQVQQACWAYLES